MRLRVQGIIIVYGYILALLPPGKDIYYFRAPRDNTAEEGIRGTKGRPEVDATRCFGLV